VEVWIERVGVQPASLLVFGTSSSTDVNPYLSLEPNGGVARARVGVQSTAKNEPLRNLKLMQWEHFALALKLQAPGGTAVGAIGSDPGTVLEYVDPGDAGSTRITNILLGLLTVPEALWDVRFDNFVCNY
jgi:hypothetical protein